MKKKLGSAIREIREQRGLTQAELARSADLSTSQISNIERGEFAPSVEALEKIARGLKLRLPPSRPARTFAVAAASVRAPAVQEKFSRRL